MKLKTAIYFLLVFWLGCPLTLSGSSDPSPGKIPEFDAQKAFAQLVKQWERMLASSTLG